MTKNKIIWIDFTNVPHVNFLYPIYNELKSEFDFIFSLRDFAETLGLFNKRFKSQVKVIGSHSGGNKLIKVFGVIQRFYFFSREIKNFDIKLSVGGDASNLYAKFMRKTSITFDDNEQAPNWRYSKFTDYAFWPLAIEKRTLIKQGFREKKTYQYDGYKEDLYIADFKPDKSFLGSIPFADYVVVRPENIQANYVEKSESIVPALLKLLERSGYNILYLPRYKNDKYYVKGIKNIYIPEMPLNGLDICYYAKAVLTGAGTLSREAACLGIPAVSFYAGKNLLAVDKKMIKDKWVYFSRKPSKIIEYLASANKKEPDYNRSKKVKSEIIKKLKEVIFQLM